MIRGERELVLEMLLLITSEQEYSHLVIRSVLDQYDYLKNEEKAFIKRLCEGTLERMIQIDYVLNRYSKVKVNKMKPVIRNILRMGVYQILFMDAVPDSAACNEAVKLTEKKKFVSLKGFVNGVLRNIARQKQNIPYPTEEENLSEYLSVCYSMPKWIVDMWLADYDTDTVKRMLASMLTEKPVTVRIDENLSCKEREELIVEIEKTGVIVKQHPYLYYACQLEKLSGIRNLPGFAKGKLSVQDVSSMLVAEAAGIQEGDTILDVCAAPGGKALHAACKLNGTGLVKASDVSAYKVNLITEHIERMGYHNIQAFVADATKPNGERQELADIVLADVPCSGLGVIGKKSDIKYRVTEASLSEITKLQKQILHQVQGLVKEGGILLYSTCTIHRDENENMLAWIMKHYPFEPESLNPYLPEALFSETTPKGYLQLLPGLHEADGFFLARLKKIRR